MKTIDFANVEEYPFLTTFLSCSSLFFEDHQYSIIFIEYDSLESDSFDSDSRKDLIIYNFFVNKSNRTYLKNSIPWIDLKSYLLFQSNDLSLKRSFQYSFLYLASYEYDLRNDLNDWLNQVFYQEIIYHFLYLPISIPTPLDYSF